MTTTQTTAKWTSRDRAVQIVIGLEAHVDGWILRTTGLAGRNGLTGACARMFSVLWNLDVCESCDMVGLEGRLRSGLDRLETTGRQDAVDPKEREPDLEPATISVVVVALRRWRRVVQCIPRSSVVAYGSTAPVRACSRERWRRSGGDGLDIWRLYAS